MDTQKTTLNIKVIFEDPRIKQVEEKKITDEKKEKAHESDDDVAEKPAEQKKQEKQLKNEVKDAKTQLFEEFPIKECLNYNVIGRHKPIILQRLLRCLQEIANMSFERQKISIYLPKLKLLMDCGNYPLNDNVLIRGTEYMKDQVMTIVAKKRGEVDLSPVPGIQAKIQVMEKERLKAMARKKVQVRPEIHEEYKVEKIVQKRVQQQTSNIRQQPVQSQTNNSKHQVIKASSRPQIKNPPKYRPQNAQKAQRPKSPPMDPLLKLKGHLQYIKGGISKFHSFIFSDVQQFYFPEEQYNFQVERLERLEQLKEEVKEMREEARIRRQNEKQQKQRQKQKQTQNQLAAEEKCSKRKGKSKKKQEMEEEYSPKRGRVVHYDREEGFGVNGDDLDDEEMSGKEEKKQGKQGMQPGRRTNERRIGNVVDKVVEWTRWASNHRQRWSLLRPYESQSYKTALSLQQAALIVDVPKKTLDDYLFHIQFGHQNRFNFNEHCMDRFAVLRMFVNKYKREGKTNPVVVEDAKARKDAKKGHVKKRKANQKKSKTR